MSPWVVLYAVTAALFNHPAWFQATSHSEFDASDWPGASPTERAWLDPRELATRVASTLSTEETVYVADTAEAYLAGEVFVRNEAGDQDHLVRLDPETAQGSVRSIPRKQQPKAPFDGTIEDETLQGVLGPVGQQIPSLLSRLGLAPGAETTVRFGPKLHFPMSAVPHDAAGLTYASYAGQTSPSEQVWWVSYDIHKGTVSGRPVDRKHEIDTRRFVTRLHVSHGYPPSNLARWSWAVVVDVFAVIMIFWALSGLLMWWQMRPFRGWGLLAVGASLATAATLIIAMYLDLAAR